MNTGLTMQGYSELEKKYKHLIEAVDERQMETALMKPARKLRNAIKAKAPRGKTGNLKRGVVAKKFKSKIKGHPAVFVAMDYRKAPHANLVEFGTGGLRYPTSRAKKMKPGESWLTSSINGRVVRIKHTGRMPAQSYFRSTIDTQGQSIIDDIGKVAWSVIEMEANK